MAADCKSLGRFDLVGIPPAPRGVPQIEVTFDIDANGIVHVTAKDLGTGKEQSIKITASQKLSEEEVEKMKKEAEQHAEEDKKRKEEVDIINQADALVHTSEKMFKDFIARVDPAVLEQMGVSRADLDQLFVSERDLQPLRVVYGMKKSSVKQAQFGKPEDRSSQHGPEKVSVVRESDGIDGKVLVGFVGVGTSVEELPSAEAPPVGKRA